MNGIHLKSWSWQGSTVTHGKGVHARTFGVSSTRIFAPTIPAAVPAARFATRSLPNQFS